MSFVYKLENLEKPYLLIRFLWFICKVSSFFRTFAKQSIVDSNNITLTAVGRKGRQNLVAMNINAYALSYACTCTWLANDVPKGMRVRVRDANKGMMRYPHVRFADLFLYFDVYTWSLHKMAPCCLGWGTSWIYYINFSNLIQHFHHVNHVN